MDKAMQQDCEEQHDPDTDLSSRLRIAQRTEATVILSRANISAKDRTASILKWSDSVDEVCNPLIFSSILPQNTRISQHVAATEAVDLTHIRSDRGIVRRIGYDIHQRIQNVCAKDVHEIGYGAVECCGAAIADKVGHGG